MSKQIYAARFLAGWIVCVTPFVLALLAFPLSS